MARLNAYYRPANVAEALEILGRERGTTALLAGGTDLVARLGGSADAVVDLQAVGLDEVEVETDRIVLGAIIRLQTIVSHPATPDLLRETALQEGPNTLRNAGTIGGVVVGADWESELLAALLVYDAEVTIESLAGTKMLRLPAFLEDVKGSLAGGLLTKVSLAKEGVTAAERVARTPADRAIIAVVGRKNAQGALRVGRMRRC